MSANRDIVTEKLMTPDLETNRCRELLPNEISGFSTRLHLILSAEDKLFAAQPQKGRIVVFLQNDASIQCGASRFQTSELAVFAPPYTKPFQVTASGDPVLVLEMVMQLNDDDLRNLDQQAALYPYFLSYSDCSTYTERIKSQKTISRTLTPPHLFPRFGMGSVESSGDDEVASHAHLILEQLFLGLPGNQCRVTADDRTVDFGAFELLHIPRGSMHSVEARTPHGIHYIWIDVFDNQAGVNFLLQEHQDSPQKRKDKT